VGCCAFFEPFRGFEPFRFGGDSRLTHLPLTLTVSWHLNPLETEVSLVLQRDFILQRDFGYYYEILRLRRLEPCGCDGQRVRLR
jgi:hypothetical protein